MLEIKVNHIAQVSGCQAEQQGEPPTLPVKTVKNSPSMMRFKETAQFIIEMMPKKVVGKQVRTQNTGWKLKIRSTEIVFL
jgi:hypothetical protein